LGRAKIAHTELTDFARLVKSVECIGHFLGIAEEIRPVEQEEINTIDADALEGFLAGSNNVFFAEVVSIRCVGSWIPLSAYAALGGDQDAITDSRSLLESLPKQAFGSSLCIDVRQIEQSESAVVSSEHGLSSAGISFGAGSATFRIAGNSPTSIGEATGLKRAFPQLKGAHKYR
jgi:hypothetical protein